LLKCSYSRGWNNYWKSCIVEYASVSRLPYMNYDECNTFYVKALW